MAAPRSLVAILLLSVVAANLVEDAVSLPEVSLSARKALNHGESAGLVTTLEEAWSTLGDALKAAAQVLRGSPLIESLGNPGLTYGGVTDIKSNNQYREALQKDKIIIEFWAEWNGPSRFIAPAYEHLANNFPGNIAFYRVDIDDEPDIVQELNIRGVPTFVAFSHGERFETLFGASIGALAALAQKLADAP